MSSVPDPLAQALADLNTAVTNEETQQAAIITLLQGLAAQLSAVSTDPAAVEAIAQKMNNDAATMAAAVVANTPGAPPAGGTAASSAKKA